jgi:hypothetical protein
MPKNIYIDILLWFTVGFFLIGFLVLTFMKRNVERNKSTTSFIIWWIVGSTAWGGTSIFLIVWWFNKTW